MSVSTYTRTVTADMLDADGIYYEPIPAAGLDQQVMALRVVAPALTGATTGIQWAGLAYRVGDPAVVIEAVRIAPTTRDGALAYTPGSYSPDGSDGIVVEGAYTHTQFTDEVPLHLYYQNSTDIPLPGEVRIDVVYGNAPA